MLGFRSTCGKGEIRFVVRRPISMPSLSAGVRDKRGVMELLGVLDEYDGLCVRGINIGC